MSNYNLNYYSPYVGQQYPHPRVKHFGYNPTNQNAYIKLDLSKFDNLSLADIGRITDKRLREILHNRLLRRYQDYDRYKNNILYDQNYDPNIVPNIVYDLPKSSHIDSQDDERQIITTIVNQNTDSGFKTDGGSSGIDSDDITFQDLQEAVEEARDSAAEAQYAQEEAEDIVEDELLG